MVQSIMAVGFLLRSGTIFAINVCRLGPMSFRHHRWFREGKMG